ncbi:peptide deformylase [Patescibacteria group bacterium]|nr:peptide deformylase [Patescibacteria group bacterium]
MADTLKIITTNNGVLLKKAVEVKKFDKKLLDIIDGMKKTLNETFDPVGVGLAAPQVGLPLRLFITKPTEKSEIKVFVNPQIIEEENIKEKPKKTKKKLLEGCLSIPNIWGNVSRKREVTLEYHDEKGKKHRRKFTGFPATIIQHEMDHLNGVLFTKRVLEQKQKIYKSFKNSEGEDEFEEMKI